MKLAPVGDVHASLPALEAVLTDAGIHGAEMVCDLGDCLGHGPFPEEVIQRPRAEVAIEGVRPAGRLRPNVVAG